MAQVLASPQVRMLDAQFVEYARTRNRELRDDLVVRHMWLVKAIAAQHARGSNQRDDLEQVGYVGLIKAVERFNPSFNVPFEAYARTIVAGEISHYLRDLAPVMRQPRWYRTLNQRLHQARDKLVSELGREPSTDELADEMNVTADGVREILRIREAYNLVSLSETGDSARTQPRVDLIRSRRQVSFQLPIEDRIALDRAIERLSELQRAVVHLFFYKDLTQTEIARRLGLSQKHVSRTLAKSLERLREDVR